MGKAKQRPTRVYHYRGLVERPATLRRRGRIAPSYRWVEGWSEAGTETTVCYPWLTRRECQRAARADGRRALFVRAPFG